MVFEEELHAGEDLAEVEFGRLWIEVEVAVVEELAAWAVLEKED
jgi:hypothetical protein